MLKVVGRGLTWTDEEVVVLLNVWLNAADQAELQGAYRNNYIYCRIVSELAVHVFQRNVKNFGDKLSIVSKEQ